EGYFIVAPYSPGEAGISVCGNDASSSAMSWIRGPGSAAPTMGTVDGLYRRQTNLRRRWRRRR
ncbi:MAG: hypothetical protein VX255_13565, partial [Candidatus Latescibacterota bacterium]|nr:hypothetical protein [Candidatus Latescibacterota bacterium]